MNFPRIVVGMSGGVDSSVSAILLQRQGYEVIGLFMKNWEDESGYCEAAVDYRDVERICDVLKIPCYAINLAKDYREGVFSSFLEDLQRGWTPNPDLFCNKVIKFGVFRDQARALGATQIATGHYARWVEDPRYGRCLARGIDQDKDQTYFLAMSTRESLRDTIFPVGELEKSEVRHLAREAGFVNAEKKDSVGICFVGKRPFVEFLQNYLPRKPGDIRCLDTGAVLGTHEGAVFATLGQRRGLRIGGQVGRTGPWYVARKDVQRNLLYVVEGRDHPALFQRCVRVGSMNWLLTESPRGEWMGTAKCRYRQRDAACRVEVVDSSSILVTFVEPQWAVTAGQALVLYDGVVCLGGGIIEEPERIPTS
ncbi:tRNA 2-thiouridine(34) synthase MnmA [Pasteuria penetrans]|uniref:tRNA 2-thiouridine(34) synthase MnmA n=1 Tax=Pasteuria penetrans TaxID=86005 RepID=UPI000F9EF17C|nr:tRNA 2-thiouridine(34) synthase MnmA [Pasteuria penetrans]